MSKRGFYSSFDSKPGGGISRDAANTRRVAQLKKEVADKIRRLRETASGKGK